MEETQKIESSSHHRESVRKSKDNNICLKLDEHNIKLQNEYFASLISHLGTMKTILWQGIAISGKTDYNSNIYQFNLDKATKDDNLRRFM